VQPFGINDSGAIVGTVHVTGHGVPSVSFIYSHGSFTVLPLLNSTDTGAVATGINNAGRVVGYDVSSNGARPWLWSGGAYFSVPVSGISATALAINSSGAIIGNRVTNCCSGQTGYIFSHGATQYLTVGALNAINNAGVAVGVSSSVGPPPQTATIFENDSATSILNQDSSASGINSAGDVVGSYQAANTVHAFIWEPNLGPFDVTPPGYQNASAFAINDQGDILGNGTLPGEIFGQFFLLTPDPHGVLTPKPILPPGVPEPGSGILFSLGLAMMVVRRISGSHRPAARHADRSDTSSVAITGKLGIAGIPRTHDRVLPLPVSRL
jgi:hypothetical protein